jgi:hypothetical protein
MSNIKTNAEVLPFSVRLRQLTDSKLTDEKFTHTEILNMFMRLATQREKEDQFTDKITKEVFFTVMYDILKNTIFKEK